MREGRNALSVYYGTNITGKILFKAASVGIGDVFNFQSRNLGPVGVVYEHMISDELGMGAEFGYTKYSVSFYAHDPNTGDTYRYEGSFKTIRLQMRVNYHFQISDELDCYALAGAGYRNISLSVSSDDPSGSNKFSYSSALPIGLKAGFGMRYFATKYLGFYGEFAFGSPLLCGGLSLRF